MDMDNFRIDVHDLRGYFEISRPQVALLEEFLIKFCVKRKNFTYGNNMQAKILNVRGFLTEQKICSILTLLESLKLNISFGAYGC